MEMFAISVVSMLVAIVGILVVCAGLLDENDISKPLIAVGAVIFVLGAAVAIPTAHIDLERKTQAKTVQDAWCTQKGGVVVRGLTCVQGAYRVVSFSGTPCPSVWHTNVVTDPRAGTYVVCTEKPVLQ